MKAACVLLCLALARLSAGHIFRRQHYPHNMELIVQPLNYIDQNQLYQQQQQQLTPDQYQAASTLQGQYRPRPAYQEPHQYQETKETRYQQNQEPQQSQETKESRYQQNQEPQQYQETKETRYQKIQKTNQQSSDSTSNESNSQETRAIPQPSIHGQFFAPQYADSLPVTGLKSTRKEMKPAYGDVIAWNGVRIASSPIHPVTQMDIEKIFNDAYTTMTHNKENKKIFHQTFEAAAASVKEDATLNATELLQKYKYPVEEHMIKTDDGYYLTLFRIPAKEQSLDVQKPVVFLMHGLLGSADDWLLMGPGKSLAYLLADAGYDVWLGNARGSKYSRWHASKHPALSDFWQFGTDEIALHDLPAMIDYALQTSNQKKMYYVGHSSGTTAFFALAATRPEYNEKIIMMYALSPMVYMSNTRSPLLRMVAPTSPFYERLHQQIGHGQFKPSVELVRFVGGQMLENEIGCKNVSSNINFVMSGVNVDNMEVEQIPVIMRHLPAGASTRQIKQYGQAVASQEFAKYDYGMEMNEMVYGTRQPPKYEMKKVQAPVTLYYSEADWLASPVDVRRLESELPNVKDSYLVKDPLFAHMDFQFGKNAPEVLYKRLIESINDHQSQRTYVY